MPIVSIQIVGELETSTVEKQQVQNLTNTLGGIFDSAPGTTWVRLSAINQDHYAENDLPDTQLIRPVFVEVLKRTLADSQALADEAQKISAAVAQEFGRPVENVHILYLPAGEGRIAFGGKL